MEKTLPHSTEAEIGILGSIMLDPEAITLMADTLRAEDFYKDAHRLIYQAMMKLYERDHVPPDSITVADELERRGKLEDAGGFYFITALMDEVPTSGNIEQYRSIVVKKAEHRRLIHSAGLIAANAYQEEDNALAKAEEMIFQIGRRYATTDFSSGSDILSGYIEKLEYLHNNRGSIIGVPTGYRVLDRVLGGLQKSDLIIAAARPGMGKSSFACSIAYHAIMAHRMRVAIFSLEMSKEQLMQKFMSYHTGIDSQLLRNGNFTDDDWDGIVAAENALSTDLLQIDDTAALPIASMRSKARRLHAERSVDLIVVDYLQLMQAYQNGKRYENRLQELQEISAGLKAIAKELNVPVLALAQLSRAVEARQNKIPQLSDLRESGSIENDADVVMFLYRDDYYNAESVRPETADIIVEKHRQGPTGEATLHFSAKHTRFFNSREECHATYGGE